MNWTDILAANSTPEPPGREAAVAAALARTAERKQQAEAERQAKQKSKRR